MRRDEVVDAYLDRLGLEREPPAVEALFRLHRAHVERVPYEVLWIHLGEPRGIEALRSAELIATSTRGGYCFHLNGALSWLLDALGYDVTRHVGGVHTAPVSSEGDFTNHLVLTVAGLPADVNPGGTWYVDAGLGDALHEPLPLLPGTHRQKPFEVALTATPDGLGDWHLDHDPAGSFAGMAWHTAPATMDAFAERHHFLSTSPESGFVRVLALQRREAGAVDILRGLVYTRVGDGESSATLSSEAELHGALSDVFGIDVGALDAAALAALWSRVRAAHEAWELAGQP